MQANATCSTRLPISNYDASYGDPSVFILFRFSTYFLSTFGIVTTVLLGTIFSYILPGETLTTVEIRRRRQLTYFATKSCDSTTHLKGSQEIAGSDDDLKHNDSPTQEKTTSL
jgi:hypothetical protein